MAAPLPRHPVKGARVRPRAVLAAGLTGAMLMAAPASAFIQPHHADPRLARTALALAPPGAGPLAPGAPVQEEIAAPAPSWSSRGYEITARARFEIEAVVLGRKAYTRGALGALVPLDLALAWGPASDPEWIRHLRVTQSARLYEWAFPPGTPLTVEAVVRSSANMHMIPGTDAAWDVLGEVRRGDLVQIEGYLVDIAGPGEFSWPTSLVRDDTGRGSCEIVLIDHIEIRPAPDS